MELSIYQLFPEIKEPPSFLDLDSNYFNGKSILVTGGAGSIGSSFVRILLRKTSARIWALDNDESRLHNLFYTNNLDNTRLTIRHVDICDRNGLRQEFNLAKPDIVVHTAALKHVPILEAQPRAAYMCNIVGTQNIIDCVELNKVSQFLFVSSDKAANPKSILGKSKKIGEQISLITLDTDKERERSTICSVVRFGNVFLSRGSVIETFIRQIEMDQPITITHPEMTRYFMDIDSACELMIKVLVDQSRGISILKMGEPILILEVAKRLAKFKGVENFKYEIIGIKAGEKIEEELFSKSESSKIVDLGAYYNLSNPTRDFDLKIPPVPSDDTEARKLIIEIADSLESS